LFARRQRADARVKSQDPYRTRMAVQRMNPDLIRPPPDQTQSPKHRQQQDGHEEPRQSQPHFVNWTPLHAFWFPNALPCMIMAIRIVQVDAFTNKPFAGNPAAVCVLRETPDEKWMRDVAREMNLSETAFLVPQDGGYNLRWLTPAVEVALCGHATVAAAHVLWQDGYLPEGQQARFHTRSGLLTADRRGDWIELDFPAKVAVPAEAPPDLLPALG